MRHPEMTIKDLATPKQLKLITNKYKGLLLSKQDKIDILLIINTDETLKMADTLKKPRNKYYPPKGKPPLKSYFKSDLYKLMLIM